MRENKDWLNTYLKYVENSEPPELFHKWVAVSTIAAVLQRKVWIEWDKNLYPNFYIVLVGPPAVRKGTAMGFAQPFLEDLGIPMSAEAETREALIKTLDESMKQIIFEDGEQKWHSSLTVFSPEFTVFIGYNNPQLLSDLADWFDCRERWKYKTKNSGTNEIIGLYLNLIGATTPRQLQLTLPINAVGSGLTSRIIFVYARKKQKIVPAPFRTPEEKRMYESLLRDLNEIHLLKGQFKWTESFFERWMQWYPEQEARDDERFHGHMATYKERRATHLLKLSMIMSVSRSDELVIDRIDLDRGIEWLEEVERLMPLTFAGFGESDRAALIQQILSFIATTKTTTIGELARVFINDIDTTSDLLEILGVLVSAGHVKYNPADKEVTYIGEGEV